MEIKKKKCVLLEDEALDWLQIWTVASSLDVKGNKATKKNFVFLANRSVFTKMVTYRIFHKRGMLPFLGSGVGGGNRCHFLGVGWGCRV